MCEKTTRATQTLVGVCHFHSETGTEGGWWAFQDERHIHKNVPRGFCKKCGKYLSYQGKSSSDKWCADDAHEEYIGDLWDYEGMYILKDGDHLTIYLPKVFGIAYYAKDDPSAVVWSGTIKLREYDLFTEHAYGLWIHHDQEGVPRDTWAWWFMWNYPAVLTVAEK